jgi:chitinase
MAVVALGVHAGDMEKAPSSAAREQQFLMGYYPNWNRFAGYTPEKIPYGYLTHVLYAFYFVDGAGNLANSDPTDDVGLKRLVELAHAKGVKVLVSIGGASAVQSANFKSMAAGKGSRANFVQNCLRLVDAFKLDGIDLDWEFPVEGDGVNQEMLHKEMRAAFDKHPSRPLFTAAVPVVHYWAQWSTDESFKLLDYVLCMTYDYMGTWEKAVIPNSGMDQSKATLEYFEKRGIPKSRLVLGAAFYGKSFDGGTGMGSSFAGMGSGNNGIWVWKDLLKQFEATEYKIYWDEKTQSEYALGNDEIIVFNGIPSQRIRGEYIRNSEYAGVMLWDLSCDVLDRDKSLLVSLYRGLRGSDKGPMKTPPSGPQWTLAPNPD